MTMNEQHPFPWTWEAKGNYSQIFDKNEHMVASDMEVEQAKFIVECVNREHKLQSALKPYTYNAYPFVVETLQREGSCPRYRVSRHRGGGVYSDEFLDKKEAELTRHRLEREEASNEQLRYRVWQLERALREAYSHVTLLATGETPPLSNAEMVNKIGEAMGDQQ
jgi:hypothetical protein